jgi:acyl carrier protein
MADDRDARGAEVEETEVLEMVTALTEEFELESPVRPADRLVEDLGFDSLGLFELVGWVEERAGATPATLGYSFPSLETIEDVIEFYGLVRSRTRQALGSDM